MASFKGGDGKNFEDHVDELNIAIEDARGIGCVISDDDLMALRC
jgi:hypothetical protein